MGGTNADAVFTTSTLTMISFLKCLPVSDFLERVGKKYFILGEGNPTLASVTIDKKYPLEIIDHDRKPKTVMFYAAFTGHSDRQAIFSIMKNVMSGTDFQDFYLRNHNRVK